MLHFFVGDIKTGVTFYEENWFVEDLVEAVDDAAFLVIDIVELTRLVEDALTQIQEVNIVTGVKVLWHDRYCLCHDRGVFHTTLGQENKK